MIEKNRDREKVGERKDITKIMKCEHTARLLLSQNLRSKLPLVYHPNRCHIP